MKKVLGTGPGRSQPGNLLAAEGREEYEAIPADPAEEALTREAAVRGHQPNLSFFAFTATPKGRTLEMLGSYDEAAGHNVAFHTYSMRQAI